MAIKGLTDRAARWPRLGTLRKGRPQEARRRRDGSTYSVVGKDLGESFRFDGIDAMTQEQWRRVFGGDEVTELEILLPYEDLTACWEAWREEWGASGLVRRCDGETITAERTKEGGYSHEPRPCPKRANGSCPCNTKPTGRLTFTVPAFARMGTITLTTTSIHDIMAIDGTLKALAATVRDLRLVPLRLSRIERQITMPAGDGGRRPVTKWLVNLEAHPDWVERQLEHQRSLALSSASEFAALPAPEDEEDDAPRILVDHETGEVVGFEGSVEPAGAEIIDAEDDEPEPAEQPASGRPRPWDADTTVQMIQRKSEDLAGKMKGPESTAKQRQLIAIQATELFGNAADYCKPALVRAAFEVDSTTKLTEAQAAALLSWMKSGEHVAAEAAALVKLIEELDAWAETRTRADELEEEQTEFERAQVEMAPA